MKLATKFIAVFLAIAFTTFFVSCAAKQVDNETQIQILEHNLSIHKFGGDVLQSQASIDGKAKNTGSSTISSASISANFFDKDGNLLHTSSATAQNLKPGEIWLFNIRFNSPDAWKTVRYDIAVNTQ